MEIIAEDEILRVLVPTEKEYLKRKDDAPEDGSPPYLFRKAYLANGVELDECLETYEEADGGEAVVIQE